jgi:hypothetical protein
VEFGALMEEIRNAYKRIDEKPESKIIWYT